jgi:hypothetical protein
MPKILIADDAETERTARELPNFSISQSIPRNRMRFAYDCRAWAKPRPRNYRHKQNRADRGGGGVSQFD